MSWFSKKKETLSAMLTPLIVEKDEEEIANEEVIVQDKEGPEEEEDEYSVKNAVEIVRQHFLDKRRKQKEIAQGLTLRILKDLHSSSIKKYITEDNVKPTRRYCTISVYIGSDSTRIWWVDDENVRKEVSKLMTLRGYDYTVFVPNGEHQWMVNTNIPNPFYVEKDDETW